ncbi:unnamed protein product [Effrenium voratum]|uniref:Uncharacterized protein n=1 Tax=Effrenium voratum TaxID=2562239 RepID=A0AA36JK10_9DINO|nr:unnamed protein product [Effrenium voratum]
MSQEAAVLLIHRVSNQLGYSSQEAEAFVCALHQYPSCESLGELTDEEAKQLSLPQLLVRTLRCEVKQPRCAPAPFQATPNAVKVDRSGWRMHEVLPAADADTFSDTSSRPTEVLTRGPSPVPEEEPQGAGTPQSQMTVSPHEGTPREDERGEKLVRAKEPSQRPGHQPRQHMLQRARAGASTETSVGEPKETEAAIRLAKRQVRLCATAALIQCLAQTSAAAEAALAAAAVAVPKAAMHTAAKPGAVRNQSPGKGDPGERLPSATSPVSPISPVNPSAGSNAGRSPRAKQVSARVPITMTPGRRRVNPQVMSGPSSPRSVSCAVRPVSPTRQGSGVHSPRRSRDTAASASAPAFAASSARAPTARSPPKGRVAGAKAEAKPRPKEKPSVKERKPAAPPPMAGAAPAPPTQAEAYPGRRQTDRPESPSSALFSARRLGASREETRAQRPHRPGRRLCNAKAISSGHASSEAPQPARHSAPARAKPKPSSCRGTSPVRRLHLAPSRLSRQLPSRLEVPSCHWALRARPCHWYGRQES